MMAQLRHIIREEFITFFRDPTSRQMLLGAPIVQFIVFSLAGNMEINNVDLAIYDRDHGQWSQELVQRLEGAPFVSGLVYVDGAGDFSDRLDRREVLGGVRFAGDFSRSIEAGQTGAVQVTLDGRRANSSQVALSYLQVMIAELNRDISGVEETAVIVARHWFNSNLQYLWFMVPALAASLSMFTPAIMTTLSIARERELGTFDQLIVAPLSPFQIILGKMIPAILIGLFSGCLITLIAVYAFDVPYRGSFPLMFLAMIAFVLSIVGIGLVISTICNTQQQAMLGMFFLIMPLMMTSGFMTPTENMPEQLQYLSELNPLKHYLITVVGCFLKNMPASEVWANTWPNLLIASFTLLMTFVIMWRSLH